jgi:hypothetical protein
VPVWCCPSNKQQENINGEKAGQTVGVLRIAISVRCLRLHKEQEEVDGRGTIDRVGGSAHHWPRA